MVFAKQKRAKGKVYALQKPSVTVQKRFTESFLSLRSTPHIKYSRKIKKATLSVTFLFCVRAVKRCVNVGKNEEKVLES